MFFLLPPSTAVRYGRVPKRSREIPPVISTNGVGLNNIAVGVGGGGSAAAVLCNSFNDSSMPASPTTPQAPNNPVGAAEQNASVPSSDATNEMPPLSTQLTVYDIIRMIGDGHQMFCTYVDDLMRHLPRVALEMPTPTTTTPTSNDPVAPSADGDDRLPKVAVARDGGGGDGEPDHLPSSSSSPSSSSAASITPPPPSADLDDQRVWLWQQSSARITTAVQHVVEFAKRIPGFSQFDSDEQLILIKVGFYEVWLVQVTRTAMHGNERWADAAMTFDDGCYLTAAQIARMYNVSGDS